MGGKTTMSEAEFDKQEPQFAAFLAIDWADKKHVWCLQGAGSEMRESGELEHSPEAVEAWVGQLCQRFAHRRIAVALEQSRGALVFMLSKYEALHLSPCRRRWRPVCAKRCIRRGPKMTLGMPTCCWIYYCSIATSYAVGCRIRKRLAGCKIWSRSGANWWTRRPSRAIA